MFDITKLIILASIHILNPDFLGNDKEISLWKETAYIKRRQITIKK